MLAFSIQYRSRSGWMVTEAIWLLLQCDKLWHGWLVAKNFDD